MKSFIVGLLLLATTFFPNTASAQWCPDSDIWDGKINTAIGCIPVYDQSAFLAFILRWAFGVGGAIAFVLIVMAGVMIMTSAGNPDKIQAGKELLTSAISGLLLLIFSVFILQWLGFELLNIGEFAQF